MAQLVRSISQVSRHGGSQFAVILLETSLQGDRCVAEKIHQRVAEEMGLILRIGIAEFPADAVAGEELVAEAEAALEFAKTASLRIADRSLIS